MSVISQNPIWCAQTMKSQWLLWCAQICPHNSELWHHNGHYDMHHCDVIFCGSDIRVELIKHTTSDIKIQDCDIRKDTMAPTFWHHNA